MTCDGQTHTPHHDRVARSSVSISKQVRRRPTGQTRISPIPQVRRGSEPAGRTGRGLARSGTAAMQVIQWLMAAYPRHPSLRPLADSVPVALQRLAAAGLLRATASGIGTGVQSYSLTPDGEAALAEGSVAQRLGGS